MLPADGLTPSHGYPLVSISTDPTLRAAAGSVLYLVLVALLSLGVATAIRDTAVSIGAVLGLLYLPPILAQAVNDPLRRHLEQIAPMTAGLAIQATTDPLPADRPLGRSQRASLHGRLQHSLSADCCQGCATHDRHRRRLNASDVQEFVDARGYEPRAESEFADSM